MREMIDTITTIENYLRQDPLVKVTEKLGYGDLYKRLVINDLIKSPYVQIDGNTLIIHEAYDNNSVSENLKTLGYEALSTARYIACHPKDIAGITYDVTKAIITNPKAIAIGFLGIAIGGSGCISQFTDSTDTSNNIQDLLVKTSVPEGSEIIQKTTSDGLIYYEGDHFDKGGHRSAYDTDNDGKMDVIDSAVAAKDGDFKESMESTFNIPIDSSLYQDCPDMKEFRTRSWFNDDNECEKIEIFIDGEFAYSTTKDINQYNGVDIEDVKVLLCWYESDDGVEEYARSEIFMK